MPRGLFVLLATARAQAWPGLDWKEAAYPMRVVKNASDAHVRFVFVAGVEGSGHHAWNDMTAACARASICRVDDNLYQQIKEDPPSANAFFPHSGGQGIGKFTQGLAAAARRYARQGQDALIFLNVAATSEGLRHPPRGAGKRFNGGPVQQSYPRGRGENKPIWHPDVALLATMAEHAGVDLRVVVLSRDAKAILASVERRHLGRTGALPKRKKVLADAKELAREAQILADNAAVLATQLGRLDAAFVACARLEELGDSATWQKLAPWLHPRLAATGGADAMRRTVKAPKAAARKSDFWAAHLRAYTRTVEAAAGGCGGAPAA